MLASRLRAGIETAMRRSDSFGNKAEYALSAIVARNARSRLRLEDDCLQCIIVSHILYLTDCFPGREASHEDYGLRPCGCLAFEMNRNK